MKRCLSITFLLVYLFSMTELHQLVKTPMLVKHYLEHQKENQKISLIGFLEMHYFSDTPVDADYEKDMQLPFKNFHDNHPVNVILALPEPLISLESQVLFQEDFDRPFIKSQIVTSNFLTSIWQPPKKA